MIEKDKGLTNNYVAMALEIERLRAKEKMYLEKINKHNAKIDFIFYGFSIYLGYEAGKILFGFTQKLVAVL